MILVVGLLLAADERDDAVRKEREKLQGDWLPTSQESKGDGQEKGKLKKHTWVFEGDKLTIKEEAKSREHTFKIDPTMNPKTIDISDKRGDAVGLGIYKLDGDTLTIALDKPNSNRPTEFRTKKDSSHVVIVLRREKKQ
jgi:RNA polymerase sigma-70 factor (ECF subfamily)